MILYIDLFWVPLTQSSGLESVLIEGKLSKAVADGKVEDKPEPCSSITVLPSTLSQIRMGQPSTLSPIKMGQLPPLLFLVNRCC